MPVSKPSAVITIGKIKGVIVSRMPMIITPLIMLPNRRTARASVRDNSLMILNGNMMIVGWVLACRFLDTRPIPAPPDAIEGNSNKHTKRERGCRGKGALWEA